MAAPLPLSEIFDHLPISTVEWTIQRQDELSITGAGEVFQANLADVLWSASVTLATGYHNELKQAAALIRSLSGASQSFLICDPTSLWPQADPKGVKLGTANVTVRTIGSSRAVLALSGLPAGYQLTVGDKLHILYGASGKYAFHEVSRTVLADASGNADVSVFPWLPLDLVAAAPVTLVRASCPVVISKDTHRPGTARRSITENAQFTVIQRRREA